MKFKETFVGVLLLNVLPIFLLVNLFAYLIGSFLAWDWDISHWMIFKHWLGRLCLVFIVIWELIITQKIISEFIF